MVCVYLLSVRIVIRLMIVIKFMFVLVIVYMSGSCLMLLNIIMLSMVMWNSGSMLCCFVMNLMLFFVYV